MPQDNEPIEKNGIWMTQEHQEALKRWHDDFWTKALWGFTPEPPKYEDKVKLAWVIRNGNREMVGVHNEDMQGYLLDEKYPVLKTPLIPLQYDSFERWCTSFDV